MRDTDCNWFMRPKWAQSWGKSNIKCRYMIYIWYSICSESVFKCCFVLFLSNKRTHWDPEPIILHMTSLFVWLCQLSAHAKYHAPYMWNIVVVVNGEWTFPPTATCMVSTENNMLQIDACHKFYKKLLIVVSSTSPTRVLAYFKRFSVDIWRLIQIFSIKTIAWFWCSVVLMSQSRYAVHW